MVQLIVGKRGKGKTKQLLDKANSVIKEANGTVDFLDKSAQHMYELNNKIRLINVNEFPIDNEDAFIGFVSGIVSQDHDLEYMFLDSFLKLSGLEGKDITDCIKKLEDLGEKYKITFVLSVSMDAEELPDGVKKDVAIAL
ncbi:twitching motility protein PilT [Oribacterium sp. HCP28S3_H8]|jgi:energy-coupling factor transporter ATP-binding protein EcfA2|uniref:twitching motility protein PilT n=1 Tax=Oribacterium sp. HCP28S3_H8 TaxID=3438945 RepID=UPI003043EFC9|nr:twitching motility protein PilT [Oribacterium sp.]